MALNDYETSRSRGQPVELYKFVYGTGAASFLAFTDGDTTVIHDGITYAPMPAVRGAFKANGSFESLTLSIEVPLDSDIAELFRIMAPLQPVSVFIRQGHIPNSSDPVEYALGENFPVAWVGRVLEVNRGDTSCTLSCEAGAAGMSQPGLRRNYQLTCPLVLYGPRCKASKAAAKIATTVSAITGNRVTLPAGWMGARTAFDFIGGLAEWDTVDGREYRTILRIEALQTLVLTGTTRNLSVGGAIDVFLGCAHTVAVCEGLHNNIVNYGGQPFIPTENPVGKNNHT